MTLKQAVDQFIKDGDNVGIGGFVNIRQPIAITHEMVRHGFKDLTLSWQSAGMAPDYLAGAMMVLGSASVALVSETAEEEDTSTTTAVAPEA